MDEFLKGLSEGLIYVSHEEIGNTIIIKCRMARGSAACPHCGAASDKVNRRYRRVLKDIPFGEKKVILEVEFNSYFCVNNACEKYAFTEYPDFAEPFSTRTKRLNKRILELTAGSSGTWAESYVKRNLASVSDTTINRIVKKNAKAGRHA